MITTDQVKELRERTGISVMQCKKALDEAQGDLEKAEAILRERSKEVAAKKASRELGAGVVASYVHSTNKVGSLVELLCETDFVAKNEEFKALAYDIAMQVAASEFENFDDPKALMEQDFIKDPSLKISDLIQGAVQKFGERTEIGQFTKFVI